MGIKTSKIDKLPIISIVTPSYNEGQFIEKTIQSVINQNYPNIEYIIIDGGSEDDSPNIINRYKEKLSYLCFEPDSGQTHAINKGFRKVSGEIVTWLNSDDFYLPGTFEKVASFFLENPEIDCVYGDMEIVDEETNLLCVKRCIPYDYKICLYTGCLIPQPASFFKKSVFERIGFLDEKQRYFMDYEFFTRMGYNQLNFGTIRHSLSAFRLHQLSKTVANYPQNIERYNILWKFKKKPFKNKRMNYLYASVQKNFYKIKMYGLRCMIRGDFLPLKADRARKKKAIKFE